MSIYYTDTIETIAITYDSEKKSQVEGTPATVKGYWEEDSAIRYGKDGLPIEPIEWAFFPKNVSIKKGDLLRLTKKDNIDVSTNPDYTAYKIAKKVNIISSLGLTHYEVQI